jgi:hypothetical protein
MSFLIRKEGRKEGRKKKEMVRCWIRRRKTFWVLDAWVGTLRAIEEEMGYDREVLSLTRAKCWHEYFARMKRPMRNVRRKGKETANLAVVAYDNQN